MATVAGDIGEIVAEEERNIRTRRGFPKVGDGDLEGTPF